MQSFLNANSGIVSRIGYTVEFEDYTVDELIQIFKSMMKKSGFILQTDAIKKVKDIIEEFKNTKNFGNARFIRNLYEKTVIKHAANTKFMDEFRARLKALSRINKNENIEKILDDLLDISLGSDPITNDKTVDSESELLSLLQELDDSIKNGSEDEARDIIEKTRNALLERNVLCKAGK